MPRYENRTGIPIVTAALLLFIVFIRSVRHQKREAKQTDRNDQERDADQTSVTITPVIPFNETRMKYGESCQTNQVSEDNNANRRPKSTWADWFQVMVQVAILGGAIWAVNIYSSQLTAMNTANDQGRVAINAALRAANSAREGVNLARDTSRLDQRAWVAPVQIKGVPKDGEPLFVGVGIKNTGKTFAKNVLVDAFTDHARKDSPDPDFEARANRKQKERSGEHGTVMAPNADFTKSLQGEKPLAIGQTELYEWGLINLFFWGRITYDDIFGCQHWTTFCVRYIEGGKWEGYGPYNDVDSSLTCNEAKKTPTP